MYISSDVGGGRVRASMVDIMYAVFDFDSHIVLHSVAVGVSLSLHVCHVKAT